MATLTTYRNLVVNEVQDTSTRAQAVIDMAIRDTYNEILTEVGSALLDTTPEDIVATIDQRFVTPTEIFTDYQEVFFKGVGDTDFRELDVMSESDYYALYINAESGTPNKYYVKGSKVYFDIAPDNAGTVKVVGTVAVDELDGSVVSVIPDRWLRTVVLGSVARFKAYEGLPDAESYLVMFHGPSYERGVLGGALARMARELKTKTPIPRPKFFGRK